jgi:hypothetical protein
MGDDMSKNRLNVFSQSIIAGCFILDRRRGSVYDQIMNARTVFIVTCLAGIGLFFPGPAAAETLGRLFLTPEQRSSLEVLRSLPPSTVSTTKKTDAVPAAAVPDDYVLNGMVTQSSSWYTIWLNGVAYTRENLPANVKINKALSGGTIFLTVPGSKKAVSLRPGQRLDANTGSVREPYEPAPRGRTTDITAGQPVP